MTVSLAIVDRKCDSSGVVMQTCNKSMNVSTGGVVSLLKKQYRLLCLLCPANASQTGRAAPDWRPDSAIMCCPFTICPYIINNNNFFAVDCTSVKCQLRLYSLRSNGVLVG